MDFLREIIIKYPRIVFVVVLYVGMTAIRASFRVIMNVVAISLFTLHGIPFLTEIFPIMEPLNGVVSEIIALIQKLVS